MGDRDAIVVNRKNYIEINISKCPTTFFYEKMRILPDDFTNDLKNDFFKKINTNGIKDPTPPNITTKELSEKIKKLIKDNISKASEASPNTSEKTEAKTTEKFKDKYHLSVNCINIICNHIFKYNINKLWYDNKNTIFLFPTVSTSTDHGESLLLYKNSGIYDKILERKPPFNNTNDSCKYGNDNEKQNGVGNSLEYLNIISEDDEDIESFKNRLKENLESIKQKIKNRESGETKTTDPCKQFQKIIFFVNKINGEEDPMFIKYYKKGLKKEFISALKEQLNSFFNTKQFGSQYTRYTNSLPDDNNIDKITKDFIINKLRKPEYGYEQTDINKDIDNIQLLVEKFKMFYKRETDENYKKSITSSDNSDLFNIFMRFNNLDTPVITGDIIANRDTLYLFKEKEKKPKIGYFYVSNLEKHQYIFNLDLIENKRYKVLQESKGIKSDKKPDEDEVDEETETKELEDSLIVNPLLEIKDSTRKILVEVKLEFGKLIFRNIQKNIRNNYESTNEIIYYGQRKGYDYYRWFNHRMIDTSLTDNINIRFFKDTIYDVKSFKAYLDSEKKLLKDTRVALEFLKINASPEILKYNDYIFNNFKENINPKLYLTKEDNYSFEEKIKKGIVDILFEKNSLVYIKETKQISEKEKETATPQNYKIIKYKYNPIFGTELQKLEIIYNHFQEKVSTSVDEKEIDYYKNRNNLLSYKTEKTKIQDSLNSEKAKLEKGKSEKAKIEKATPEKATPEKNKNGKDKKTEGPLFDPKDTLIPPELFTQMSNTKKTLGILIVDVSKDVFSNPISLYLAAECKTRSKRLQDTYYNFKKYFSGGTNKKKRIKITRNKNRNNYKSKTKSKPKSKSKSKLRRI
jgi:hypothetical protein